MSTFLVGDALEAAFAEAAFAGAAFAGALAALFGAAFAGVFAAGFDAAFAAVLGAGAVFVADVVAVSFFVVAAAGAVAFGAVAFAAVLARVDVARSSLTVSFVFVVDRVGIRTPSGNGEVWVWQRLGITKTHVKSLATL
jgi:hypothetical protein